MSQNQDTTGFSRRSFLNLALAASATAACGTILSESLLAARHRDHRYPQDAVAIDSVAPQLLPLVAISWDGEASRISYSVGPQSKSDPISVIGADTRHRMRLVVSRAGAVSFFVDSRLRWTSSLRFLGSGADSRARLWLGGRATGDWGAIQRLVVHRP